MSKIKKRKKEKTIPFGHFSLLGPSLNIFEPDVLSIFEIYYTNFMVHISSNYARGWILTINFQQYSYINLFDILLNIIL